MGFDISQIPGYRFLRVSMIFIDFRGIPKIARRLHSICVHLSRFLPKTSTTKVGLLGIYLKYSTTTAHTNSADLDASVAIARISQTFEFSED